MPGSGGDCGSVDHIVGGIQMILQHSYHFTSGTTLVQCFLQGRLVEIISGTLSVSLLPGGIAQWGMFELNIGS